MNYVRGLLILFALSIANDLAPALANSVATNQPRHFASALPNRKGRIQLDRKLKKELNDWFSIFALSGLPSFGRNSAKDQILIDFALERIIRYDELQELAATDGAGVAEKTVEALVAKILRGQDYTASTTSPAQRSFQSKRVQERALFSRRLLPRLG